MVIVEVEDHGIGIPREEQEKIFERFYRVKNGAAKGGYGLGLYLVRHIMDAHGGKVELESEPGEAAVSGWCFMDKILIIEDEEDLLKGLELNLSREGYQVLKAANGEEGMRLALRENPHLILLDIMLPGMNGLDVCRELRHKGFEAPIIMLTARSEEVDRVVGLEIGADDYVTKPFSRRELLARIRVRLRRQPARSSEQLPRYKFDDVEIDFEKYCATKKGAPLELTPKEYDILRLMIRHHGEVLTRDRMLNEVWGYEAYPTSRTVDTHIVKLRQKLEDDPANPKHILSIYGEGYKFVG